MAEVVSTAYTYLPQWSPDGRFVLYHAARDDTKSMLCLYNTETKQHHDILPTPNEWAWLVCKPDKLVLCVAQQSNDGIDNDPFVIVELSPTTMAITRQKLVGEGWSNFLVVDDMDTYWRISARVIDSRGPRRIYYQVDKAAWAYKDNVVSGVRLWARSAHVAAYQQDTTVAIHESDGVGLLGKPLGVFTYADAMDIIKFMWSPNGRFLAFLERSQTKVLRVIDMQCTESRLHALGGMCELLVQCPLPHMFDRALVPFVASFKHAPVGWVGNTLAVVCTDDAENCKLVFIDFAQQEPCISRVIPVRKETTADVWSSQGTIKIAAASGEGLEIITA